MNNLKIFGLTIIFLIVTAFLTTPSFFENLSMVTIIQIICMLVFLITISITTIIDFRDKGAISLWANLLLIAFLFLSSSSVFLWNQDYFTHGLALPLSFWHRVSFYTLPAITLESAIVTAFVLFIKIKSLTKKEYYYTTSLFFMYTLFTLLVNFMVIGDIFFTVTDHLRIARVIIITFAIITLFVIRKSVKNPA